MNESRKKNDEEPNAKRIMHILKNIIKTSDTSNLWCKLEISKKKAAKN